MDNTRAGPNMSVNGGRSVNNNFTFNGANFTHFGQTTGLNFPPPDAVQEIRIQTHNFTSEYGNNSGSQVTVTSKAGTNQFHGSAWEFLRNDKLNARSFFQPRRPTSRQNQAGAAAGGPISRDRLFALAIIRSSGIVPKSARRRRWCPPTPSARQLHRRAASAIRERSAHRSPSHRSAGGLPCVAGNIVAPGCISKAAQTILDQFIPRSRRPALRVVRRQPSGNYSFMGRVDFLQSRKHTLFGHFHRDPTPIFTAGNIQPFTTGDRTSTSNNFSVTSTYTFSPTFLNQATFDLLTSPRRLSPKTSTPRRAWASTFRGLNGEGISVHAQGRFDLAPSNADGQDYKNWHFRDSMSWIKAATRSSGATRAQSRSGRSTRVHADAQRHLHRCRHRQPDGGLPHRPLRSAQRSLRPARSDPIAWKHFFFFQDEFKVPPGLRSPSAFAGSPTSLGPEVRRHTVTDIPDFRLHRRPPDSCPACSFPAIRVCPRTANSATTT